MHTTDDTRAKQTLKPAPQEVLTTPSPPENLWPQPDYATLKHEPSFLFILTPPYSGSTALAKVLNTAHRSMLLHWKGEGQWLVPGMRQPDRWNPEKVIEWDSVKAVWLAKVRQVEKLVGEIDVVIEKSPANLVRAQPLLRAFPNHQVVTFNRNPYANCASILYRHHDPQTKTASERLAIVQQLAADWLFRSQWVQQWRETLAPIHFTYEAFCRDPQSQICRILERLPVLTGIEIDRPIEVKDYPLQTITNHNGRQIALLSRSERAAIAQVLQDHETLLNSFGYTSRWQAAVEQGGAGDAPYPG
ncbi:MAG: sulfotransferase [Cyanobacteria bacterium P01_G01_bin.54]